MVRKLLLKLGHFPSRSMQPWAVLRALPAAPTWGCAELKPPSHSCPGTSDPKGHAEPRGCVPARPLSHLLATACVSLQASRHSPCRSPCLPALPRCAHQMPGPVRQADGLLSTLLCRAGESDSRWGRHSVQCSRGTGWGRGGRSGQETVVNVSYVPSLCQATPPRDPGGWPILFIYRRGSSDSEIK